MTNIPPVDGVMYRNAMAHFAGHVQLVTTQHGDNRRGVTVTAACSVSDNPPTVLVCLNASNPKNALFAESGRFALNCLANHHRPLADGFAGFSNLDTDDRFALAEWTTLATGAPVLTDALVSFDCRLVEIKEMSTHMILFGEVKAIHTGPTGSALVYMNRQYQSL